MARTIEQIKRQMTERYIADPVIREKYGLTGSITFEEAFSRVSIESIIFFVVASAIYVLESIFDRHSSDVDEKIAGAVLASLPWYHKTALAYQHGDELSWSEKTHSYGYAIVAESRRPIRYAACRDMGGGIRILVSGVDESGGPKKLPDDILTAFKYYINRCKPAGVMVDVYSLDPDALELKLSIQYNPLILNANGSLIREPYRFPVENAIEDYLKNIIYGGTFNKTKLIDSIQKAEGVVDVVLTDAQAVVSSGETVKIEGNNYTAKGGSFEARKLKEGISYVLSL